MLLTTTTTHRPPSELGYLLAKHPDRVHRAALPFGTATADEYDYRVSRHGIGDADAVVGAPTQLAVFSKGAARHE